LLLILSLLLQLILLPQLLLLLLLILSLRHQLRAAAPKNSSFLTEKESTCGRIIQK
jgi:hypothetical protein